MQSLDDTALNALAKVLGETTGGFSKSELQDIIKLSGIQQVDDGSFRNGFSYRIGKNKRTWLYECFLAEKKARNDTSGILVFLQEAFNPIRFTIDGRRALYQTLLEETNKILLLIGMKITDDGKVVSVDQASTLDEVDLRVNHLTAEMRNRRIHPQVTKYCKKEILTKDYYNIVFESAKGLAQRVREISGCELDGGELFQATFSTKNPLIFFNQMQTKSEISEFTGVKELLESIFHLVRNPIAHTPKLNWQIDEEKALDVLTMISFAHKYLDECYRMPQGDSSANFSR